MSQLPQHPILQQHFESPQLAFTQINKEIAVLQESIRILRVFRNTFTPVYRLPPEVLIRIFGLVQHFSSDEVINVASPSAFPQWLVVTFVSQHWRDVAVGCPSLWSQITDTFPKHMILEWIRRSKDIPLSITSNPSSITDSQFIGTSLFRIRELKLKVHTWNGLLSQILSSPAPLLESFCVLIGNSGNLVPLPMISDNTFAGTTPCLHRLELSRCSVNIRSSIFKHLTVLELRNPPQTFPAADLLTALHKIPGLTSLYLVNVLQSGVPEKSTDIDPITLSSLESLRIKGTSFIQDLDFLSHISFPSHTTLHFSSKTEAGGAPPLFRLLDFLNVHKSSRQQSSPIVVNSLELQYTSILLMLDLNTKHSDPGCIANLVKFDVDGPRMDDTLNVSDTAQLFSFFDLMSLNYLGIMNCNFAAGAWTALFGSLPKLKEITTTGLCALDFLSSIITDSKTNNTASKPQTKASTKGKKKKGKGAKQKAGLVASHAADWTPIFPCLETIRLEDMAFTQSTAEDLVTALGARKMVDKELKTLEMTECRNVDEYMVAVLQGVVGNVEQDEWAGMEDDYEGEVMYDSGGFDEHFDGSFLRSQFD
ncbi:hypothetical protein BDN72DRAFT_846210 [Pluteus cervinus]|uniref:Uncharacterized protein n=1 Tax=Pluteus cervinus TaxID=181527 RepID=A0ACD3AG64_9AGAR|nr:hypothetical protein BDN72DRAFT_846210 [Pluteus cervinus]